MRFASRGAKLIDRHFDLSTISMIIPLKSKAGQGVLVKRTSDHGAAEFPMKACWKEDAQVVASEPQKETATYEELKVK